MPRPSATKSDNYKLLFAIVEQIEVRNIDWTRVARSLCIDKVNTVQKRWSVLKKREGLGQNGAATSTPTSTPKKQANENVSGRTGKKLKVIKKEVKHEWSGSEEDEGQ
jgi:hypothetical protein